MKRKALALILPILFFLVAGTVFVKLAGANFFPPIDHASGIFIRSDGSVDPSTAPIQRLGNMYTLVQDVSVGIAVEKSDIVLEGNGYALQGNGSGTGFYLKSVTNVTAQNAEVRNFSYGFYLDHSNSSLIKGNALTVCGITITQRSCYNQIVENSITGGGISLQDGNDNVVINNSVNGISVLWSTNIKIADNRIADEQRNEVNLLSTDTGGGSGVGGINIDNSGSCNITGNVIERKIVGVNIWHCTNLNFSGNLLRDNQCGFKLWGADLQHNSHSIDTSNTIDGKPIYFLVNKSDSQVPNDAGWIAAVNCRNITIQNWVSTPNWDAILFINTNNSKIINSNLTHSFNAIRFDSASNCLISHNRINNNGYAAFYFEGVVNCIITENDVANNFCFFNIWHGSVNNTFFRNNFVGNWTGSSGDRWSSNFWDNGSEGNYWSTYNGKDSNEDGISDAPYLIDSDSDSVDRYPLMNPVVIPVITIPDLPDGENTATPNGDTFLTVPVAAVSVATVAVVGAGLLIYFKKRRRQTQNNKEPAQTT